MDRNEAIDIVKKNWPNGKHQLCEALKILIPELKKSESEDERIKKDLIEFLENIWYLGKDANFDKWGKADCSDWMAWIEKQGDK